MELNLQAINRSAGVKDIIKEDRIERKEDEAGQFAKNFPNIKEG